MLSHFADWLSGTPASLFLQERLWIVPASQSVHIIGVSVVFASTMMVNLRVLGIGATGRTTAQLTDDLLPWVWRALAVLLVTGAIQTIAEPARQFVTPAFWAKMMLLCVAVALTAVLGKAMRRRGEPGILGGTIPAWVRAVAIASIVVWIAVIVCGRLIGYTSALYA